MNLIIYFFSSLFDKLIILCCTTRWLSTANLFFLLFITSRYFNDRFIVAAAIPLAFCSCFLCAIFILYIPSLRPCVHFSNHQRCVKLKVSFYIQRQ